MATRTTGKAKQTAEAPARRPGRPRREPKPPTTPATAEGVTPVVTIGDLERLADRLGVADNQAAFAEQLRISQSYMSYLLNGGKQLQGGPLHQLIVDRLQEHGLLRARGKASK